MAMRDTEDLCNSRLAASSSTPNLISQQDDTTEIKTESVDDPRYVFRSRSRSRSRKRAASPVTANEPIQKRSRIKTEQSAASMESPLPTTSHNGRPERALRTKQHPHEPTDEHLKGEAESFRQKIEVVMGKVDSKHSESFKLRELRRQIWQKIEECDSAVVVAQRYIVGLNGGDRDHFLGHLNSLDRKLEKMYDKMDGIQDKLDDNHAKVDELLEEHGGLLTDLARVEKIIRDRIIRAKDM